MFKPRFTLIGEEKITLSLQESYQEYGYEVFYRFKSYHEEVKITENIDVSKVGEYVVTYYVPSLDIRKKRIVEVKDVKLKDYYRMEDIVKLDEDEIPLIGITMDKMFKAIFTDDKNLLKKS